jgi:gluconolactonase
VVPTNDSATPGVGGVVGSGGSAAVVTPGEGGAGQAGAAPTEGAGGVAGAGGESAGGAGGESTGGAGGESAGGAANGGVAGMGGAAPDTSGFVCPEGPFEMPAVESTESVCTDFDLRYSWNEGPAWVPSRGSFFFTNFVAGSASGGDIIEYTPGVGCETFVKDVGCNGLAPSIDGGLLAACQQTRSIQRFDLDTKQASTVADEYQGMMLDTPNDLVQHSNGTIYFTNPPNELAGRPQGVGPAAFRIEPDGTVQLIKQGNSNGIALSPEQDRLYVVLLAMWDLDEQGVPSNEQAMFTRGDGIAVDCAGNVYADGSIFTRQGNEIGNWGSGTNLAFGGEDGRTVLVAGPGTGLRQLRMNVPGPP